ncbi:MAG: sulfatase [Myxococcota bacterium]
MLVVLDTARGDRFSLYGHEAPTSPRLADFASDALVFERAYANSCWTVASHASLFTGLLPATHGATQEHVWLDGSLETLASLLGRAGYQTAAFSNNAWVSESTDLVRGFDRVVPLWKEAPAGGTDAATHPTNRAVADWLAQRDAKRPFLAFVNYIEPHWPYEPPDAHRDRFLDPATPHGLLRRSNVSAIQWYLRRTKGGNRVLPTRSALYDAELSYTDAVLGDLLDRLAAGGWLEDALVVVTSDHGEHLGEHGHLGHSFSLYDPTLRIPLVIRPPGGAGGKRRSDPVQLADVFATIAAATGVTPADARVVGRDLLAGPLPDDRPLVAEYYRPDVFSQRFPTRSRARTAIAPYQRRLRSLRVGDDKLIWASDGTRELYDTRRDPQELRDRAADEPERVAELSARLEALVGELVREPEPRETPPLDPEVEANLRALGYL